MDRESYQRAYSDSLEHVLAIFNRLCLKKKLGGGCECCAFVEEIQKLRLLVKNQQFDQVEHELGYFL